MKRLFVLTICLCLLFAGCGEKEVSGPKWEPQRASADAEPYAQQTIKIIDQYLSFEISKDAAKKQFDEVYFRIKDNDYDHKSANYCIESAILSLTAHAKEFTDTDFHMYRDILSYQIGEEVSGKVYAPKKKRVGFNDEETYIANFLNIDQFPYMSSYILNHGSGFTCSLDFDAMTCVKVTDLREYAETIITNARKSNITFSSSISFDYYCYDQLVFTLSFDKISEDGIRIFLFSGSLDQTLGEYDSLDKIPDALKVAEDYFGKYAP